MKTLCRSLAFAAILFATNPGAMGQAFWGLYGGTNSASLKFGSSLKLPIDPNDKAPTFKSIQRLHFGFNCELPLSKIFFLQPEFNVVQRGGIFYTDTAIYNDGSQANVGNFRYEGVNNLDLYYLQIPILVKVRWQFTHPHHIYPHENTGTPWFLEWYAGPAFNYLAMPKSINSTTVYEAYPGSTNQVDTTYKFKSTGSAKGLSPIDVSAVMGMNIKWRFSRRAYAWAGVRYSMNFLNINKDFYWLQYVDANDGSIKKTNSDN